MRLVCCGSAGDDDGITRCLVTNQQTPQDFYVEMTQVLLFVVILFGCASVLLQILP